jgi:hypothetical protein
MTREELSAMTDQELLAYQREHHGDLYVTLARRRKRCSGWLCSSGIWGQPIRTALLFVRSAVRLVYAELPK